MSIPGLEGFGRVLIVAGIVLVGLGLLISYGPNVGLGHLPGDILIRRGNTTFYFPLTTSAILSILVTVLLLLILRRR